MRFTGARKKGKYIFVLPPHGFKFHGEVDGPVYADIPEIECDWETSYGKSRPPPPPPPPSPVEVNIMDLKLDELVGRYAPLRGVRIPKYFESAEEEEAMLGSSFEL
ncbi:hypothetical protein ONZ45_g12021 [Pleurotus djamor]|nr:hypothetical protein ONZ45_g12021 [Pleurotus djamor]